jgi:hypothetical protein
MSRVPPGRTGRLALATVPLGGHSRRAASLVTDDNRKAVTDRDFNASANRRSARNPWSAGLPSGRRLKDDLDRPAVGRELHEITQYVNHESLISAISTYLRRVQTLYRARTGPVNVTGHHTSHFDEEVSPGRCPL